MPNLKIKNAGPGQNNLMKSLFKFFPYWPMFTFFILLAVTGCFAYSFFTTPLYEASAKILIQDKKKGTENSKAIEDIDVLQSKKIIDNEIEVITSKPLVTEVIRELHLYAPVFKQNKLRQKLLYENSPVIIEVFDPAMIKEKKQISFRYDANKPAIIIGQQSFLFNSWYNTPYGRLRFLPTVATNVLNSEKELSFLLLPNNILVHDIQSRLKAAPTTKLSSIIELSYRDENAQRAETFTNSLLAAYINAGKTDKNNLATNTLRFIDERIKVVETELHAIEKRKQQYASKNGAFDISTQGRLFLENVSANDQKMSDINLSLSVLNEVEDYVSSKKNSSGTVPSTIGISDPLLSQLVEKLYNSELEYEALKKTAGENNPIVLPLKNRIEQIKPSISELINNQQKNLQSSRQNIFSTNSAYNSLLNALPKTEREMVDLDREQNIKSSVYSFLLQKREESALSQQSVIPETRLISTDVSEYPVSPNMKLIYLCASMLAVLLGVGLVLAKESFGNKVMFRDQIEHATGFPVVGEISTGNSQDPIVISDDQKTFIAEQFRRLRMTLNFHDEHTGPKKILVTSAISGEGKSFIASNLALTLALAGKKVALLDFDLNNPSLNNKLNISHYKGITDFLLGECSLPEIIYPTDLDPNLYLLSTGRLPHNPTELLMNGRTALLLEELEKDFDYIVIDTAPVIPVTDAYILSKFCDTTLYVIRHKYTPKIFLERMDEDNKMHRLNNVGIIFNSVSSRGLGNNNYGYGYGYGYTYENSRKGKRLGNSLT